MNKWFGEGYAANIALAHMAGRRVRNQQQIAYHLLSSQTVF